MDNMLDVIEQLHKVIADQWSYMASKISRGDYLGSVEYQYDMGFMDGMMLTLDEAKKERVRP